MSSRNPSTLNYSLHEFSKHGGLTHANKSGWGIAYYEDDDVFLVKEALPASASPLAKYISDEARESTCVIAHVRLATTGSNSLKNTHPFRRALGRRTHVFAHNGDLKGLHDEYTDPFPHYEPIGETDSELAFCILLERLFSYWTQNKASTPSLNDRLSVFADFASEMSNRGSANFLYSDGDALFVHAHKRMYEENGAFSEPRAPGLSIRNCVDCQNGPEYKYDGLNVSLADQVTTIVASVPLDDFGWEALPEGVVIAIRNGKEIARVYT